MPATDREHQRQLYRESVLEDQRSGHPIYAPDLKKLGFVEETGAAAVSGTTPEAEINYSEILETICGVADDSQAVEQYDGTLGVTQNFVNAHQSAVAQVQWNANLASIFTNPGTVNGARWGSGTMIAPDLFLTAGHLFDQTADGWVLPVQNGTANVISPQEIAQNMHVNFNFQVDANGVLRTEQSFAITQLIEYRLNGLDFAVCRIAGNPGDAFGTARVAIEDSDLNDMLCIIGHPAGLPKRIEAGPTTQLDGDNIRYNDIDTLGGNSGSGILHEETGALVGVHTNGGCNATGTGSNRGVRVTSVLRESPTVRNVAHAGRWVARHGLSSAQYQATFDELTSIGYRPLLVNGAGIGDQVSYAAIFEHRPGPAWVARHGLSSAQYQAAFDEFVGQGFRPTIVSAAGVGGNASYAAIFEQQSGPPWVARHGLTSAQYQAAFDELVGQGFRLVLVNGAGVGNQVSYAAVWEQSPGPAWVARHGLTSAQYQAAFDEFTGQGFRPVLVSGAGVGDQVFYAAIWEQRPGPDWVARHGLTSAQYQATFDDLLGQGFRPVVVSGAGVGGQVLYAAIWERR
jgi:V8-like Glu-specific endopeptidase